MTSNLKYDSESADFSIWIILHQYFKKMIAFERTLVCEVGIYFGDSLLLESQM